MKANTASRTAQYMALFRALESARHKRLFDDPYASLFLDRKLKGATWLSTVPLLGCIVPKIIESKGPGALSSGIARTKYIDDLLERTVHNGSQQVIILGSGFDTRALRLQYLQNIPVIEIDHPDTAALKQEKLKEAFGKLPSNLRCLQIDFNDESLESMAEQYDLNFKLPTTIIWEGVTNYISAEAVDNTFLFLSRFAKNSSIIFTYIDKRVLENPQAYFGTEKVLKTLRKNQEEWTFGFYPEKLEEYLKHLNFKLVENKNAIAYRGAYMPERAEILKGYEFTVLLWLSKNKVTTLVL